MKPQELKINKKKKIRSSRGNAGRRGGTSGRGTKGQRSRTSRGNIPLAFEGGQTALKMRLPKKRGFRNILRKEYQVVNVGDISAKFKAGDKVNRENLLAANLIKKKNAPLKILGNGEINKKLEITADGFSSSAAKKIEKAGGKVISN